ncbi:hypothetical protein H6G80_33070 [Nostoc sp. FACHB-87]|uniref:hypothetical protein n=1 Tax=Nostocaceae TaxID=1162 RepID=UPI001687F60F|nr:MULTISPECIES: hypothetical protein [Nostocaceae]MBD2458874.1 hypothetical protein [Nostoc sp. FACHB-87]MBD2479885.1 hypothetical protein [Anabaena sp. FACHB-83]
MDLPDLLLLVESAKYLISQIEKHPDYQALDYQPDLTVSDAKTALSYLKCELETNQQLSVVFESVD